MARIKIEWDHGFDKDDHECVKCFHAPGEEIKGSVTIGEGPGEKRLAMLISRNSSTIQPIKDMRYLPEITGEQGRLIRLMAEAYFAGMSRKETIVHWELEE